MIRFVSFDFWQTLFAETPEAMVRSHALRLAEVREALGRAGYRYDAAAVAAADERALAVFRGIWGRDLSMSAAQQIDMFLDALDPGLSGTLPADAIAAVGAAYEETVLRYPPAVAAGAVEAIRALRARGLGLGVISNTGRTPGRVLRQLLARAGVLDAFRVLSFSDEVGVRKPARAIFLRTLAGAEVSPVEAIHLGDDPVADVGGAHAAEIRVLHYVADGRTAAPEAAGSFRDFAELPTLVERFG